MLRKSKVLAKLRKGDPVFCLKDVYAEPDICEMMGCLGTDVIWICNEHLAMDPERMRNVIRAVRAADANGKWCGTSGLDPEYTGTLLRQGVRFITTGSDYGMIRRGVENTLAQYRKVAEETLQ